MQKIATRVFIVSSIVFGILGVLVIMTLPEEGNAASDFYIVIVKLLFTDIFVVLPSFALSVASKYLNSK